MPTGSTEERLALAVKADDGFFTTFFVSSYSPRLVLRLAKWGVSPNAVTLFSMAVALFAAAGFSWGTRTGLVIGAILLQVSFTFDCVDGQLARFTGVSSSFGAWLDSVFDRTKEYLVYAALAYGFVRTGGDPAIWTLAAVAMSLQVVRHFVLFSYNVPFTSTQRGRGETRGFVGWLRAIVPFPIGERFAVISLTAAFTNPEVTFVVLIAWGLVALVSTTSGRVVRSLS